MVQRTRQVFMIKDLKTGLYSNGVGSKPETTFVDFTKGKIFERYESVQYHIKVKDKYATLYENCAVIAFDLVDVEVKKRV